MTIYLSPKFTLVFFFTGKYSKRLFVCGRGVKVELLKTPRFVLCSFQFGIHTMHGEEGRLAQKELTSWLSQ